MALRRWFLGAALLVACGGEDSNRFFPPESDATAEADATADDVVAPSDLGTASDLGATDVPRTDVPRADVPRPTDRGGSTCPSGCATNADCLACNEGPSDLYCCVSGLCVFTTGTMCMAMPEGGPGPNDGGGDGGDGAAPDTSGNPFDDIPEPGDDGGMTMPEDRPEPGIDATAPDAASDVPNDLARADGAG